jgi:hypothetical protein
MAPPKDLLVFHLVSGVYWIGKVQSEDTEGIMIEKPRMLVPRSDDGKKFIFSITKIIGQPIICQLYKRNIEASYPCEDDGLAMKYLEEVTGIKLATSIPKAPTQQ